MVKTLLALIGALLFIASITLGLNLRQGNQQALAMDDEKQVFGMISDEGPPPCTWAVTEPERVMSENKSQAVVVEAINNFDKDCESILALRAPGFDISPSREEQKISVPASNKGSLSWILTPRKTGTFEVSVSDILNTKILGITVTNVFGLSTTSAKIFSLIGTLLGPMITVPWWWDRWFQRRDKSAKKIEPEPKAEAKSAA